MNASKIEVFSEHIYRNSTYIEKLHLGFSQFFVRTPAGGVLCIETGMRAEFPQMKENLQQVGIDIAAVGNVIVPHFEADEMGALPDFLAHNKSLTAYAHPICTHALADIFAVKTKALKDEVPVTINGEEVIPVFAKHVHQWDSLVVYLPRFKALFSSDVFMRFGPADAPAGSATQVVDGIVESIEKSGYLPSVAHLHAVLEKLRKYEIESIFPMHGPAIHQDIPAVIDGLAAYCTRDNATALA